VLSYWYATVEDVEAAALEAGTAVFYVNILDEAVFEASLGQSYRDRRSQDRLGRVVTGLELVRNCETHAPVLAEDLLVVRQLFSVPLYQGGQIMRSVFAWAEFDSLPAAYREVEPEAGESRRRARGEAQHGYRKAVQGRHVIETLLDAVAFFESIDERLIAAYGPPLQWAYGEAYGELPTEDVNETQAWLLARPMGLDHFELFLPDIVCRHTERRSARWPAADVSLRERRRRAGRELPGGEQRRVLHRLYEQDRLIGYSGLGSDSSGSTWVERRRQVWRDVRAGYRYYVCQESIEVDLGVSGHEQVAACVAEGTEDLVSRLPPAPPSGALSRDRLEMVETYDDMYLEMRLRADL
jgi:hypothetical protein